MLLCQARCVTLYYFDRWEVPSAAIALIESLYSRNEFARRNHLSVRVESECGFDIDLVPQTLRPLVTHVYGGRELKAKAFDQLPRLKHLSWGQERARSFEYLQKQGIVSLEYRNMEDLVLQDSNGQSFFKNASKLQELSLSLDEDSVKELSISTFRGARNFFGNLTTALPQLKRLSIVSEFSIDALHCHSQALTSLEVTIQHLGDLRSELWSSLVHCPKLSRLLVVALRNERKGGYQFQPKDVLPSHMQQSIRVLNERGQLVFLYLWVPFLIDRTMLEALGVGSNACGLRTLQLFSVTREHGLFMSSDIHQDDEQQYTYDLFIPILKCRHKEYITIFPEYEKLAPFLEETLLDEGIIYEC